MLVRAKVTRKDIAYGAVGDAFMCPVALAVGREVPGMRVAVDGYNIDFWRDNHLVVSVPLPEGAMSFVEAFDATEKVKPFTFEVDVNEP